MIRCVWLLMFCAALTVAMTGCSQPYVNIPAQEGQMAGDDPNARGVQPIMAVAVRAVLRNQPLAEPVLIQLPRGSNAATYELVTAGLEADVVTPLGGDEAAEPASTLEVQQIRIRGSRGEVDLVRPRGETGRQFVTVYLSRSGRAGWVVDRIRPWEGQIVR